MPTWPASLPLPRRDDYALEPVDPVVRSEMESGPARQRRRFTTYPTRIPVRWSMTDGQFAVFEAWHAQDVSDGQDWFTTDLLNGVGRTSYQARFAGIWRAAKQGAKWIVTATLEVLDRPLLTGEALAMSYTYPPEDVLAMEYTLHQLVHTSLPGTMGASGA